MFDKKTLQEPVRAAPAPAGIDSMDVSQLLELRQQIEERLPPTRLSELDLEAEILLQYAQAKALLSKVVGDAGVPANQKAQCANTCAAILEQLIKMQTRLYSAERMKSIEQLIIKVMKDQSTEVQEAFFAAYERLHAEEAQ